MISWKTKLKLAGHVDHQDILQRQVIENQIVKLILTNVRSVASLVTFLIFAKQRRKILATVNSNKVDEEAEIGLFYRFSVQKEAPTDKEEGEIAAVGHYMEVRDKWIKSSLEEHGTVALKLTPDKDASEQMDIKEVEFSGDVDGVGDTGAQMCVAGRDILKSLNLKDDDLTETKMKIKVADDRKSEVIGVLASKVEGRNSRTGEDRHTSQLIYFVEGVKGLYLSKNCVKELGLVSSQFPTIADEKSGRKWKDAKWEDIGRVNETHHEEGRFDAMDADTVADGPLSDQVDDQVCEKMHKYVIKYEYDGPKHYCGCPKRPLPPDVPESIPFELIPENVPKIESWIF